MKNQFAISNGASNLVDHHFRQRCIGDCLVFHAIFHTMAPSGAAKSARRSHCMKYRMKDQAITYATLPEVMIYQVARTIRDGELVFHGYGSPVPALAMLLAKRTHAPHMVHIEGATYAVNPDPAFLPSTSNDW